ncbi:MAG: ParA family protein [Rhodospirillaceae bacterium]|nr:ParA family protein [Rhodospirillaceae bacterium]
MAKVLVVATSKGGTGKTTIAVSLAGHWREAGKRVALYDTDPNMALTRWCGKGEALSELTIRSDPDEHSVVGTVGELGSDADYVIIDTAGFGNQAMVYAVGMADLVLIPVMTDEASLFEAIKMKKIIESARGLTRRPIPFRTVLNRIKRAAVVRHTERQLENLDLNPLQARIHDRSVFQEASYHGATPNELGARSRATLEIRSVARELEPAFADD